MSEPMVVAFALLWVITLGLCVLTLAVLRHLAYMYELLDPVFRLRTNAASINVNELLPVIRFHGSDGEETEFPQRGEAARFVLVAQPECAPCQSAIDGAKAQILGLHKPGWVPVVVVPGDSLAAARLRANHALGDGVQILGDHSGTSMEYWGITTTPTALVVDADGRVTKKLPSVTAAQIRQVLNSSPPSRSARPLATDPRTVAKMTPIPAREGD